jgi:CheY-like chemotaxis protein
MRLGLTNIIYSFTSGLGLYSLAKRMDGIGGTYGVRRRKDGEKGSVFWFEIPYRPDEMVGSALAIMEEHHVAVAVVNGSMANTSIPSSVRLPIGNVASAPLVHNDPQKKLKVLLADDSLTIVKMIMMMLSQKGHIVHSAVNGEIAVSMLQQQYAIDGQTGYDVVLIDLQMPVMDGLEATRRWRQLEAEYNAGSREVVQEVNDAESESSLWSDQNNASKSSTTYSHSLLNTYSAFPLSMSSSRSTPAVNKENVSARKEIQTNNSAHQGEDNRSEMHFSMLLQSSESCDDILKSSSQFNHEHNARKSKKKRQERHQFIIGMSANSDHETMEDAFKAGVDDFIKKPFTMENFLTIIRRRFTSLQSSAPEDYSTS